MSGFETRKQTSLLRQNENLVKRNEGAPRMEGEAGQAGRRRLGLGTAPGSRSQDSMDPHFRALVVLGFCVRKWLWDVCSHSQEPESD